ncbi:DUF4249 domain-containing protein [bacterium SCSIO 12741]|nr:DUF4249 domain-containing protein [bacterium SCSIO 12741]
MKRLIGFLAVLTLVLTGCQENIDFELNSEKSRIVVEATLTDSVMKHPVKLTMTTSYYETQSATMVDGATVTITDGTTTWPVIQEGDGLYYTPEMGIEPSKTYTLRIEKDGEVYEGTDSAPIKVKVDSVVLRLVENPDFETGEDIPEYSVVLFAQENPGLGDHYLWKYYVKKPDTAWRDMTPRFNDWSYAADDFVDGRSPAEGWEIFGFIDTAEIPTGSLVKMEMYSISKEYYEFLSAMSQQTNRGGLFDGPPANIPTNMSNNAIGFFNVAPMDYGIDVNEY